MAQAEFSLESLDLNFCNGITEYGIQALVNSHHAKTLRRLDLTATHMPPELAHILADAPFEQLEWLNLAGNQIDLAGAEAMAASPHLRCLYRDILDPGRNDRTLIMRGNPIKPAGYGVLAGAFGTGLQPKST